VSSADPTELTRAFVTDSDVVRKENCICKLDSRLHPDNAGNQTFATRLARCGPLTWSIVSVPRQNTQSGLQHLIGCGMANWERSALDLK
jgi:hypothetical protein